MSNSQKVSIEQQLKAEMLKAQVRFLMFMYYIDVIELSESTAQKHTDAIMKEHIDPETNNLRWLTAKAQELKMEQEIRESIINRKMAHIL